MIVDEIHAVAQTKRGAHLALTLERLAEAGRARRAAHRAVSATQNPLEEVGALPGRPRRATCTIVDTGVRKPLDLRSTCRSSRWSSPSRRDRRARPVRRAGEATRKSIWPAIYPELLELVREHRSTIVFVNNRRGAERLALRLNELAEERRSPAPTTARSRARSGSSSRSSSRRASCRAWWRPRRSSSASTWARSTSCCRSSRRSRSPPGCSASAAPATASARSRRAASSRSSAPTCSSARSSPSACARA